MRPIHDRLNVLSVPVRTRMLRLLGQEELGVGEVARIVQLPQSTVSRHLKVLLEDGWVVRRRVGNSSLFMLSPDLESSEGALWELVRAGSESMWPDDGFRLSAVLAAREPDGAGFFGRVADRWQEMRQELYGDSFLLPMLLSLLPPDMVVADYGCGAGDVVNLLAPHVKKVIGVDREPAMLEAARSRIGKASNVELREGVLEAPPVEEGSLDVAFLNLVLHHIEDPSRVLAAVSKTLKPDGKLIVVDMVAHDRVVYRRTMAHIHLGFPEEEFRTLAADGGMKVDRYVVLPPDQAASGPVLFMAVLHPA